MLTMMSMYTYPWYTLIVTGQIVFCYSAGKVDLQILNTVLLYKYCFESKEHKHFVLALQNLLPGLDKRCCLAWSHVILTIYVSIVFLQ